MLDCDVNEARQRAQMNGRGVRQDVHRFVLGDGKRSACGCKFGILIEVLALHHLLGEVAGLQHLFERLDQFATLVIGAGSHAIVVGLLRLDGNRRPRRVNRGLG